MPRSLVTGADGFVGQHLVRSLLSRGDEVVGAVQSLPPRLSTLSAPDAKQVRWVTFDLEDREGAHGLIRGNPVDRVFHLAAFSSAAQSRRAPEAAFQLNVLGSLFLLEELANLKREKDYSPTILISGSGSAYGSTAARVLPLTESCPLEPLDAYSVSKAAQEFLGLQYHRASGLPVIVTRSFNHTGPGQRPPFVVPDFATQLLDIRDDEDDPVLRVGNIDVRRDFTDVRDVVEAYVLLSERGTTGSVYNVCSGRSIAIRQIVEMLAEILETEIRLTVEPERVRKEETLEVAGDFSRLADATGWGPQIPIEQTLRDLVRSLQT